MKSIRKNNILCIYNDVKTVNLFKNYYPKMLKYNTAIYVLYYGGIYNSPFFNTLIFTIPNQKKDDYLMCWNMVLEGGYLIIPKSELKYFKTNDVKSFYNTDFAIIYKNNSKVYIFYDKYRIIDFMIIGINIPELMKHDNIFMNNKKLDFLNSNWIKSINWYKNNFNYKKKMVGDYNENILYLPYLHPMLQKINPCIKLIIILKNPINRAYEEWTKMYMSKKNIHHENSFEKMVDNELKFRLNEPVNENVINYHYLQKGLYYKHISALLKYFPLQNIYISTEERLFKNIKEEKIKIYNFLQVYNTNININTNIDINSNISKQFLKNNVIKQFFKNDVKKLEKEILGYKTNWL